MTGPSFARYVPNRDADRLVTFLSGSRWPFHIEPVLSEQQARSKLDDYRDPTETWWVEVGGETAGLVRIVFDQGEPVPWLDIRLGEAWRGRGLGRVAIDHVVGEVFRAHADLDRIEATARRDNVASRRTLRACGFVKEAVYRRVYERYIGRPLDSIGYGLLRTDWEHGTTTPVDWDEEP